MDLATQEHLTTLRNLLLYRRGELLAEVHAAAQARHDHNAEAAPEPFDRKDEAEGRIETQMADAQEARDRGELARVEAALQRLAEGRYGDCADCGEVIAMQRLLVQPSAARCARCEAAHEAAAAHRTIAGAA